MLVSLLPSVVGAKDLKGQVVLVGLNDELGPAIGVDVTLKETGDTVRTKAQGLFRLFLPDSFKAGEEITVLIDESGWLIQYPLDGEIRIPANLERAVVEVRLLPVGSEKLWSHDRFEKFIADTAEKAKQQVTPNGKPNDVDFDRYIKDLATKLGFSADDAKEQIDQWVAEVQEQDDPYKLGLAAYAEKNFGKASELFMESAESKAKQLEALTQETETLSEETVRDFRLAGDAEYNNYAFSKALSAYQRALGYISKDQQPRRWAAVVSDIGLAHVEIGTRTEGPALQEHLSNAVTAYGNALEVYTRELLPQDWAMTQNSLGNTLRDQGTRTGGEQGRKLLADAVTAYRSALEVRTRELLPQDWAMTQNNLGATLNDQGTRTGGEQGRELLADAVTAFRNALEVFRAANAQYYVGETEKNLRRAEAALEVLR